MWFGADLIVTPLIRTALVPVKHAHQTQATDRSQCGEWHFGL
jgi:hypothetical protein